MSADPLTRYVALLEGFDHEALQRLADLATPDVHFRDPFNDCHGADALRAVFADMLDKLDGLRFRVRQQGWCRRDGDGGVALIAWDLQARLRALDGREWQVSGSSELHFDAQGRLSAHLDYWDAAGQLYERLPLLGWVLRLLRRRLRVD